MTFIFPFSPSLKYTQNEPVYFTIEATVIGNDMHCKILDVRYLKCVSVEPEELVALEIKEVAIKHYLSFSRHYRIAEGAEILRSIKDEKDNDWYGLAAAFLLISFFIFLVLI